MTNQHPITPPPELVEKWHDTWTDAKVKHDGLLNFIAAQAAQWGADQELEACCVLMDEWGLDGNDLVECRRPKPPSLKEQALEQLDGIATCFRATHMGDIVCDKIRRALEALPE